MVKEAGLGAMEKPNHKHVADSDLISPAKKAKKSEEAGCDTEDPKIPSGAEDEKQEISGGEEAIAAVGDRAAEEESSSCVSEEKKGFLIEAAAAEDRGGRQTMEDVWVVLPDASLDFPGKLRCAHFAIYDGHGGRLAAEYAKKHLHLNVLTAGLPRELMDVKVAKKAILEGGWKDGATAVCVWIVDQKVFVANIGDAKAVLARSSSASELGNHTEASCNPLKAIVLTREHKAIYPQERSRIQKSGGAVSSNGRLQGRLEVSRAFGDRQFKKFGVTATPDIHAFELTERENFMILGCDGLWEVFGTSDAVGFVQKLLKEGLSVSTISRRLVKEAAKERHCKDNCTAIVIVFKRE
ncbi:unnamed protein product [Thlaspi arvense]|uniref:PPM-type phosphatase domain-containing protein n=1 Tax=Thlaspi arvense TaxID=13288 RepID=A0AAU9RE36_THLAR|nr:unnamed protein product [Thlaspi arvense]